MGAAVIARVSPGFWAGKRVFVTGHTGFKGSWLVTWLLRLGANVRGFALPPATEPAMFDALGLAADLEHVVGDVRDAEALERALIGFEPEIVLHLAAQPIVRLSYEQPRETFATNVLGTANLLDAARRAPGLRAIVVITTDKVYENRGWCWGYRETDRLGGLDPYSASKAGAELVIGSYRASFFSGGPAVVAVRAGNVLGGGDYAPDRLVPDAVRAFAAGAPVVVRNPASTRPWQHVLEPLRGYLVTAERCAAEPHLVDALNFGPAAADAVTVGDLMTRLVGRWGAGARWESPPGAGRGAPEARTLRLDSSRAESVLGWRPRTDLDWCLGAVVDWYRAAVAGAPRAELRALTERQIAEYEALP